MYKLTAAAFAAFMLVACSSTPPADTTGAPITEGGATTGAGTGGASTSGTGTGGVTGSQSGTGATGSAALRQGALARRSVYFDFDSFTVKDEFRPTIEAHARYLQQNRSARMTIQGNTDERGSREYNIALGQKRAEAVKRMMTVLGAQDQQIETVSFGKEKPKSQGHDESSWAENRRDDMLYAGE
jgi:peptidoglycan-associated lipoprotein